MNERVLEEKQRLRRETEIKLREVYLLHSIQDYLKNPDVPRRSVEGIREKFKIPGHIPYSQFKRYLQILEERLRGKLSMTYTI